jgi:hypothetical protein
MLGEGLMSKVTPGGVAIMSDGLLKYNVAEQFPISWFELSSTYTLFSERISHFVAF